MQVFRTVTIAAALLLGLSGCAAPEITPQAIDDPADTAVFMSDSGEKITAVYRSDDRLTLTFTDGQRETLESAVASSGSRWVRRDREWWEQHGRAVYRVGGELVFSGIRQNQR